MKAKFPIPRPTEHAALRNVPASPGLPPVPVLFAGMVAAYATRDRHGLNLCAHAIARAGGTPPLR